MDRAYEKFTKTLVRRKTIKTQVRPKLVPMDRAYEKFTKTIERQKAIGNSFGLT